MQQEGTPKFLKYHQGSVRGVAFSPRVHIHIGSVLLLSHALYRYVTRARPCVILFFLFRVKARFVFFFSSSARIHVAARPSTVLL